MDNFSLTSVPFPIGYESVYRNEDGSYFSSPIIAITFQTYDFREELPPGECLSVWPKMWDLTEEDGVDEVDVYAKYFVGIKYPGETMELFLKRIGKSHE